ncbi:phosphopantothenate--cysteine ligase [Pseudolactococcus insecticola]|uniref:Phosphopantothenate--cysteine ligase n=1 Tax=Pseudolactococcus insecticola TaxID=2709158 RepID=A0A6A0B3C9_9LACT|nr:phosphopantothenate--cysteine ligase [Lactococcus insecticola]GFH39642.1 phosphopantothenate--cysteine ligase [Lactococcus insecticola]
MRVLITSGGTTENIDQVRGITNFATGSLGKRLSERFLMAGHEVILLAGLQAIVPDEQKALTIIRISDVASLSTAMARWLPTSDVVVHSMAVSDYTPTYMTDFDTVAASGDLNSFLAKTNDAGKISSQSDYQVMFLKKTPKVISTIKVINPNVILFGFKLLVDVSKEKLVDVASQSLTKNKADFILANDLTEINASQHHAFLVSQSNSGFVIEESHTKDEIAALIVAKSEETYDKNHSGRNR